MTTLVTTDELADSELQHVTGGNPTSKGDTILRDMGIAAAIGAGVGVSAGGLGATVGGAVGAVVGFFVGLLT